MSKLFWGFFNPRPPGAGVVPRPNIAAENCHLSKLVKTGIVVALRIDLGLLTLEYQGTLFFEIG